EDLEVIRKLSGTQLAKLDSDVLQAIDNEEIIQKIPCDDALLTLLADEQLAYLSDKQIASIEDEELIRRLPKTCFGAITDDQYQLLDGAQLVWLDHDVLQAIDDKEIIRKIPCDDALLTLLADKQLAYLSDEQIESIEDEELIRRLPKRCFRAITDNQYKHLSQEQVKSLKMRIDDGIIDEDDLDRIRLLDGAQLVWLDHDVLQAIDDEEIIQKIPCDDALLTLLADEQLAYLSDEQIASIEDEELIQRLPKTCFRAITDDQYQYLSQEQVKSLEIDDMDIIKGLTGRQLLDLSDVVLQQIDDEEIIHKLPVGDGLLTRLTEDQTRLLSAQQVQYISLVDKLPVEQINYIDAKNMSHVTNAQMKFITDPSLIKEASYQQLMNIDPAQLACCTPCQQVVFIVSSVAMTIFASIFFIPFEIANLLMMGCRIQVMQRVEQYFFDIFMQFAQLILPYRIID
ncbi:MAG: hypothetical protein HY860_05980, partial [Chlamydiales bacterium]|nr:hypothetical protein [Chlamydiales bacterium]